jgi:HAE1 family hydrophobic/amphiphilic exporter-1
MAIAVIGGLVASTVLSLIFVPAVFTLLDDLGRLMSRVLGRFVGERDEPEAPVRQGEQGGFRIAAE